MGWRIVMHQDGGCDYTIGCGIGFVDLGNGTLEEAITAAKDFFLSEEGSHYLTSEYSEISSAYLVQDNDDELPIDEWKKELKQQELEENKKAIEEKERKEFERLSKKFGK